MHIVLVLSKTGFIAELLSDEDAVVCLLFCFSFTGLEKCLIQGNALVCILDSVLKSGLPVSMSSVLFLHSAAFVLKEAYIKSFRECFISVNKSMHLIAIGCRNFVGYTALEGSVAEGGRLMRYLTLILI